MNYFPVNFILAKSLFKQQALIEYINYKTKLYISRKNIANREPGLTQVKNISDALSTLSTSLLLSVSFKQGVNIHLCT